jgi:hypothetical protein
LAFVGIRVSKKNQRVAKIMRPQHKINLESHKKYFIMAKQYELGKVMAWINYYNR